ncbi:MAG: hypothetical protein CMK32_16180 [Porticoccaceae bacterium]|nr:hypothetical protein [Porticoccaceae bacterium]
MIRPLSLSALAQRFGGTLLRPDATFSAVSTDSRSPLPDSVFVALRGERFDGHDFLDTAAAQSVGLVVETPAKHLAVPQWVVPDSTVALGQIGLLVREQFEGPVIAITGSSGKTSVKEMATAILGRLGPTLATRGNLNNHIGVPMTLFDLSPSHRFAVIEMGASGPGEIAYLCSIARPTIAMVNNVMPAHLEGFGSVERIASTKGEIYASLPAEGVAVINLDESWISTWRGQVSCPTVVGYSLRDAAADYRAGSVHADADGVRFHLATPAGEADIRLPLPGRHNVANALAAAACAMAAGADLKAVVEGLSGLTAVKGRMQTLAGCRGSRVIDDTYNANPGSVKAAIDVLVARPGRRVLVLGDMAELGASAALMHREVGEYAMSHGVDELWVCGRFSRSYQSGFGSGAHVYDSREALAAALKAQLDADACVLVKGSRSAGMEQVVHLLMGDET